MRFYRIDLTWRFAACVFSLGEVWRVCLPFSLYIYIFASMFILELVLNYRFCELGVLSTTSTHKKKLEITLHFYRPVMLRTFDSGVMVIQSKSHSDFEVKHLYCLCCLSISFLSIWFLLFWVFPDLSDYILYCVSSTYCKVVVF